MNIRVLAIDPDLTDRFILKKILSDQFEVITLSSAREALSFARSQEFEIAIINNKLINHQDGVLLLRQLKQINRKFLPVATTTIADTYHDRALRQSGFELVAQKPLNSKQLQDMIRITMAFKAETVSLSCHSEISECLSTAHSIYSL
jgi:DNA-binding NtrC family response regulator